MQRRKLPTGIQTFRKIREDDCYYVDKTAFIDRLVRGGVHYFLSRPRRFGKSLLVDTIKELFEGSEELFRGLHVHDRWDWSVRHPVVRLDFAAGRYREPGLLDATVMEQLAAIERRAGVTGQYRTAPGRLAHLLEALHARFGQKAAVLVDEYDKPILDTLERKELARANRDYLQELYSTLKACDANVTFALLTGVSKFSKVSLFSGPNNLTDVTLDPDYSAICGYTEADLDTVFAPELPGLDRGEIRDWYNGYNWRGDDRVYNPFDILLLFDSREFAAHWFETGTPTFLIDTLIARGVASPALDGMLAGADLLSAFDVDDMEPEALLFQTGYLTIRGVERSARGPRFRLGYPNREVRLGLNERLLRALAPDAARRMAQDSALERVLAANDFAGMEKLFRAFFAGIPYEWHTRNDVARYEGYYASVCYSWFVALGLDVTVEDSSSLGRVDLAVRHRGNVYLFEFKVVEMEPEGGALEQLQTRGYADKYRARGEPIHLIGVEFSRTERNLAAFAVARA